MPILNINGHKVTVDDSFLQLSPEQQNATVDEIASTLMPKVEATLPALPEMGRLTPGWFKAATVGAEKGLTANFSDEIGAALMTPIEMGVRAWKGEDAGKGLIDRAQAAYASNVERERSTQRALEANYPVASIAGNVAGGLAMGGGAAKSGLSLLNAAKPTAASLIGRGAAEGALYGGLYGAGEGEGVSDTVNKAAMGAGVGGITGGVVGGVAARGAARAAAQAVPTTAELDAAKTAAYNAADAAGVVYSPQLFQRVSAGVKNDLAQLGYDPALQPRIGAVLNRLDQAGTQNVTLPGAEIVRRVARGAYEPGNKSSNMMMGKIIDAIDSATGAPQVGEVLMGNAAQGTAALNQARELASRTFKSEEVSTAIAKAINRAKSSNSGQNEANAIRQELRKVLERGRSFTPEERQALQNAVHGTGVQNTLRWVGHLFPTSGIGGLLTGGAGYAALGPAGIALPATGYAMKKGADAMTKASVSRISEIIRNGGIAPSAKALSAGRQAIIDALIRAGGQDSLVITGKSR